MKLKEIGIAVFETTTAGGIAAVASNLFATPIKRTKKKTNRNPSIYDSADPKYKNTQVKGKDPIPSKSKPTAGHQSSHPFRGKLVGEGDMEADREAGIKWVDNPDWKRLHEMDLKMVKDFLNHKEGISEATMQRQHFEVIADIIGSYPGHAKIRMDFMTHAMDKLREINPQFKDSTFVARVRQAVVDQEPQEPDDEGVAEKAPPGREKQVKALKGKVDNPYAVAWASYNKGKK
jgi:hypothetical protein